MRIESMTATFGKLEGQTLTLKPGLNVIDAPNEWGKSTWCAFLLAMLYGIDTKAKTTRAGLAEKEHYAPWSGSPMSGRIELTWQGRRITLERTSRGRIPMGEFRAYETESGLAVPELTAANCGERLLGVERSVFRRAGFIRLADLPVTQDEALRRRLNALVTTGDESGDDALLQKGLRELKNRCRYNQSGLLPQAQREREQLRGRLEELCKGQQERQSIAQKLEENAARQRQLENHRLTLAYEAARRDWQKVDDAAQAEETARQRLQMAQEACRALPTDQAAEEKLRSLHQLRQQVQELQQWQQSQPMPPAPPKAGGRFAGMEAQQVRPCLEADIAACQNRRMLLALLCLALVSAVTAGVTLWLEKYVLTAVSAGMLVLALILLAVSGIVDRGKRRAICRRYGSASQEDWQRQADDYIDALVNQQQREDAYRERLEEAARRREQLRQQVLSACDGQSLEQCQQRWEQVRRCWQELAAAQENAAQAARQHQALEEMARPLPPKPPQDTCRETAEQTDAALQALQRQAQALRDADGQCRGKMEALGRESELTARLAQLEQRIKSLERYEAALELAQNTLAQATQTLQSRFAPRITKQAQENLSRLTQGKYDRLRLDTDLTLRSGGPGENTLRETLWRSDGTADQLYLALRLAVAQAVTPQAPLVLDDALVRFDDTRLQSALTLLQEIARERQILLFTCQHREQHLLTTPPTP